jgi:hypothetical protein
MPKSKSSLSSSNKASKKKKYFNRSQVLAKLMKENKIENLLDSKVYEENNLVSMFSTIEKEQNIQREDLTHRDLLSYMECTDFI